MIPNYQLRVPRRLEKTLKISMQIDTTPYSKTIYSNRLFKAHQRKPMQINFRTWAY